MSCLRLWDSFYRWKDFPFPMVCFHQQPCRWFHTWSCRKPVKMPINRPNFCQTSFCLLKRPRPRKGKTGAGTPASGFLLPVMGSGKNFSGYSAPGLGWAPVKGECLQDPMIFMENLPKMENMTTRKIFLYTWASTKWRLFIPGK